MPKKRLHTPRLRQLPKPKLQTTTGDIPNMTTNHNHLRTMTTNIWQAYKRTHKTIPKCVSCGTVILVGEKFLTFLGRLVKYCCEKCSRKPVIVYQYPTRRTANKVEGLQKDNYQSLKQSLKIFNDLKLEGLK